jgi:hypothetical protein
MKPILLLLAVLLTAMSHCRADIILGGPPSFGVNIALFAPTGQSFIADRSVLKSIGMWTTSCNCPGQPLEQFQLRLLNGSGTSARRWRPGRRWRQMAYTGSWILIFRG